MKCWRFYGRGTSPPYDSYDYEYFACGVSPEYRKASTGQFPGWNLYIDGQLLVSVDYQYGSTRAVTAVNSVVVTSGFNSSGDCSNCQQPQQIKYDCLNGDCIAKDKYNTPGFYQSLDDCQKVCGNAGSCGDGKICIDPNDYCPDNKVCIDSGEYTDIQGLLSKIKGETC